MKRDAKKLRLSVTTVRSLDSDQLRRVAGGDDGSVITDCTDCYPTHGEASCYPPCVNQTVNCPTAICPWPTLATCGIPCGVVRG